MLRLSKHERKGNKRMSIPTFALPAGRQGLGETGYYSSNCHPEWSEGSYTYLLVALIRFFAMLRMKN
jgi:hypothetical protein